MASCVKGEEAYIRSSLRQEHNEIEITSTHFQIDSQLLQNKFSKTVL